MTNLINNLELRIKVAFKNQALMELAGEDFDEDYICNIKSDFINKYNSKLTESQIDYISKI
tara:strand:+ start:2572 stop:2754 length:183 start_codon:yes stop_codon:yes gene_type:complete